MHNRGAYVAKKTRFVATACLLGVLASCGYIGPHSATEGELGAAAVTADAGDRSATLNWQAPARPAQGGIRILVSPAPESGPTSFTLPEGTQTWTHEGLTNGVTYTFTIEFLGASGQVLETRTTQATPDVVPALAVTPTVIRSLDADGAQALDVAVTPSDAIVTYTSSNPSVATVDADGRVQPLAAGRTVVTASIEGASDSVEVLVGSTTPEDCRTRTAGDWKGSGTEADPYLIYTDMDAACIREVFYAEPDPVEASFALAHNVHFGSVGGRWTVDASRALPKFAGIFDGRGFTVSGLVLEATPIYDLQAGGIVRNVTLLEPQGTTGDVRGFVADFLDGATVDQVTVQGGRIKSDRTGTTAVSLGGLVARVTEGAVVTGNTVDVAIEATGATGEGAGLLIGRLFHNDVETGDPSVTVSGNRTSGAIDAPGAYVGGVFGYAQMGGTAGADYDWSQGTGDAQVHVTNNRVVRLTVERAHYAGGIGVIDSAYCATIGASNTVRTFEPRMGGVTQAHAAFLQADTTGAQYSKAAAGYTCW